MLTVGCSAEKDASAIVSPDSGNVGISPNTLRAYLEIGTDSRVRITTPQAEMGQGVVSSLPKIVAEELEADWSMVDAILSAGDPAFASPKKGSQATGQSMSVRGYYDMLRSIGAVARDMLERAAAEHWNLPRDEIVARNGYLLHASSERRASFGEMAERASRLAPAANPRLKDPAEFRLIGFDMPGQDTALKVTGQAQYGIDFNIDGLLIATVKLAPAIGARVISIDDARAISMPGVKKVLSIGGRHLDLPYPAGVAVVAETYWQAKKALDEVEIEWSAGNSDFSSAADADARRARQDESGIVAKVTGDVETAFAASESAIDVLYEVPYLAHATMEPMTCAAHVEDGKCTLWSPSQGPEVAKAAVAELLTIPVDQITMNRMFLGGGFGRRYQRDFVVQAAEISKAIGAPVKLIWSREEDIRHDFYRPAQTMRIRACTDSEGKLSALHAKSIGPSLLNWGAKVDRLKGRADPTSFSGINDTRYTIENFLSEWVEHATPVPLGYWRSVGHSHNGFFFECAIDEMAVAAGRDAYEFRRALLADDPWMLRALDTAADSAGWNDALLPGRGRGIAVMESYGSAVAHVAEVSVEGGKPTIHRIDIAVDCGIAIDPDNVVAQMEGGTLFALTALLYGEINFTAGAAQESNFHDYRMLRMDEIPPIHVHVLTSDHPVGGIGESAISTAFASVANAIYAASGQRVRKLPLITAG
jgi:isoquinoline 1-oxidoreductase beta subunit